MTPADSYASTADQLVERIVALIPTHPEILRMNSAWDLFTVPGFECSDLQPSLYQASWALSKARSIHEKSGEGDK